MATKNPRINVTFDKNIASLLAYLAHKEHKSVANIVRKLTLEAIKLHEDFYLSKLADKLDKANIKTYCHYDAWKYIPRKNVYENC